MNTARVLMIASAAALVAACSSAPSKPAAAPAPVVANIAGTWIVTTETQLGAQDTKMVVNQNGNDIKGTLESQLGTTDFTGAVQGNEVRWGFDFNAQGTDLRIDYSGTLDGNNMTGKAVFGAFGEGAFTAKKQLGM